MGYVGNQQNEGFSQVPAKQDLTGATGTSLTLTYAVASAEGIDLFINNVRQEPTEAYSVGGDGVTVTLTGSVVATDDIYVVYNSLARQTSTHPSNQALQATSGVFSGTVSAASATVTGDLTVDTNTLYVDSTNNRVGIGTSLPASDLHINDATGLSRIRLTGGAAGADNFEIGQGTTGVTNSNFEIYDIDAAAARLVIDSTGNVGIGSNSSLTNKLRILADNPTGYSNAQLEITSNAGNVIQSFHAGGATAVIWKHPRGSQVLEARNNPDTGYININANAFVVSSDYRLKENVVPISDATERLKKLNPVRFNFKPFEETGAEHHDNTVDGFLAHEVQGVVPEAISGIKDAVDDDGNPVYQGIDQSKLVPLLVKTIQELEARITALEAS